MAQSVTSVPSSSPHIPVLLDPILEQCVPISGTWVDGTFGAGGYTRALLDACADKVIAIDRDPEVFERSKAWASSYNDRLQQIQGEFGKMDAYADAGSIDGVVLDIGVSSMQLDQAERGFSFMQDGPLDMRMGQDGPTAADIVNTVDAKAIADILFQYGEERASRKIADHIVKARETAPILTTRHLAEIIVKVLPKSKPGQPHPATRSFQALRIAVNDELGQLIDGLCAAEKVLKTGGLLVVVTFHSLEDRIVKRYIHARSGEQSAGNRHAPAQSEIKASFEKVTRKAITASKEELQSNTRSRSAKLRIARRTSAPFTGHDVSGLGLPRLTLEGRL